MNFYSYRRKGESSTAAFRLCWHQINLKIFINRIDAEQVQQDAAQELTIFNAQFPVNQFKQLPEFSLQLNNHSIRFQRLSEKNRGVFIKSNWIAAGIEMPFAMFS